MVNALLALGGLAPVQRANVDARRGRDVKSACNGLPIILILALPTLVLGQDELIVKRTSPTGRRTELRRTGTIIDYKAGVWTLRSPTGREESFEDALVVEVKTTRSESHQRALALFTLGQAKEALAEFRRAVEQEQRVWMKRILLSYQVRCLAAQGMTELAGDTFLNYVLAADPNTTEFDAMPLAWYPSLPNVRVEQKADRWLKGGNAASQLLGASWLLTTKRAETAIAMLQELARSDDRRVALLAELQLWRRQAATIDQGTLETWIQQTKKFPKSLQYGAWFLIGTAQQRLGDHTAAALSFMKVPILHEKQLDLSSQAILYAARSLKRMDQTNRANHLLRQIVQKFPDSVAAGDARRQLDQIRKDEKVK